MSNSANDRNDSISYFRPIWARRWLILLITVIATAGTYVYFNHKPRVYGSSTTLYVGAGSDVTSAISGVGSQGSSDRTLADLAQLITSPPVYAQALKLIHDPRRLGSISATPQTTSDFIALTSTGGSPYDAAATANAFAEGFIEFRKQTLAHEAAVAIGQLQAQLATMGNSPEAVGIQQTIAQLKLQEANPVGAVQQIAPAVPNPSPLSPNPKKDAIFALLLSLMVGIALAYGLDRMDQRIRSEEELQPLYGVPVVGEIPHTLTPVPFDNDSPVVSRDHWESFRTLRTNLELATGSKPLRTIMVVSAVAGEGKSLVVRNLALAYADAGFRVAIIEADLRRPSLARLLRVAPEPGLTDVLAHAELLPKTVQPVAEIPKPVPAFTGTSLAPVATESRMWTLDVVTSGAKTESLTAALAAEGIKPVLARLTEEYDIVLIDSAPLLAVSDAVPLLGVVDGVVMVSRIRRTTEHAARRVTELLSRATGARLLGVIANDTKPQFQYPVQYGE